MQLPDEAIVYDYQSLLVPPGEGWDPAAELRARHFLPPARLKELAPRLMQIRSQVAAERELQQAPPELQPLEAGFIDLPQKLLDQQRRRGDSSELGRVLTVATYLRDQVGRVVVLGVGGSQLAARALFEALRSCHHNELPPEVRLGVPCFYFAGDNFDNDALQDLLDLLQNTCVDPERRDERWAVLIVSKSGGTLEPAVAHRVFVREAMEYYGSRSERLRDLFVPVTGPSGRLRDLFRALGYVDETILTIPDDVGGRFSAFTPAGLLPAAVMGLDVRALLLGAAAMTRRFLEEPFERNPVLQYAGVNYLLSEECGKSTRVLAVWSKKLEGLGRWYEQLLAESLGKQGRGPTPLTAVMTRDLHTRGQQLQEGTRDRVINNLVVKTPVGVPIQVGMADHNEDGLNVLSRKTLPDLMSAAWRGAQQAYFEAARPTADLVLPALSEHTMGQLMQLLMLATVVEARLMGINPYGQPGLEAYQRHMATVLKSKETNTPVPVRPNSQEPAARPAGQECPA
ncbi:MAG TPA: glucose-6-phosphate isomerase [Gemmataceae bacterium]|nr:glucose-6-phosphate isomerase [Gemmataceae bacterium]